LFPLSRKLSTAWPLYRTTACLARQRLWEAKLCPGSPSKATLEVSEIAPDPALCISSQSRPTDLHALDQATVIGRPVKLPATGPHRSWSLSPRVSLAAGHRSSEEAASTPRCMPISMEPARCRMDDAIALAGASHVAQACGLRYLAHGVYPVSAVQHMATTDLHVQSALTHALHPVSHCGYPQSTVTITLVKCSLASYISSCIPSTSSSSWALCPSSCQSFFPAVAV